MAEPSSPGELLGISPADLADRFARLQGRLSGQWRLIESMNQREQTMLVVPSAEPPSADTPGTALLALEERLLCLLLLLRKPRARMVYCTSQAIGPEVVDYYLGLLPGVIPAHARARLHLFPVHDGSPRPLARKVLERPRLVERLRGLIPDPATTHLVPFATTGLEQALSVALGIPVFGADPRFAPLATRSGSRRVFAEASVAVADAVEGIRSPADAMEAVLELSARTPGLPLVRIEPEGGEPGGGGLRVGLADFASGGGLEKARDLDARFREGLAPSGAGAWERFWARVAAEGALVEAPRLEDEHRTVNVEMRITPPGGVEVQGTQDRPLSGDGGWRFPADPAYAGSVAADALRVGERLRRAGVVGSFSVLFEVRRSAGGPWSHEGLRLRIGKSENSVPSLTLALLTDGRYQAEGGLFRTRGGQPKCYLASHSVSSPSYRAITPDEIFDFVVRHGLHYDHATQTGVVLHQLSGLTELGSFGLTAVADSHESARELHDRAVATLGFEAERAVGRVRLPEG